MRLHCPYSSPNERLNCLQTDQLLIATYSIVGESLGQETLETSQLESAHVKHFVNKFRHLSGDLELPLEDCLPGDREFLEYRIGSDLNGAYVLFYFHDEVVFASLLLSGTDETTETELMQVFKFLLLDTQDSEEPTEEEIDAVLSADAFKFEEVEARPAVFEVNLVDDLDNAENQEALKHLTWMNRHLAKAFFDLER